MDPRQLLMDSFRVAVRAADPMRVVPAHIQDLPRSAATVVGAGKAAASMAAAVESVWADTASLGGAVATRHGHTVPTHRIEVLEAGHPVPDQASPKPTMPLISQKSWMPQSAYSRPLPDCL